MKLFALTLLALAANAAEPNIPVDATAAWSRLKSLAGEWEADTSMGKFHITYELIGGGTALVSRERGEKMPEMMTVYHLDGKRLILTHYCMAGNQPRMEAKAFDPSSGEIQFRFLDITNAGPSAGHMHDATFRLSDERHFSSDWQFYENGKLKNNEKFEFTRIR